MQNVFRHGTRFLTLFLCLVFTVSAFAAGPRPVDRSLDLPPAEARVDSLPFGGATSYMMGKTLLEQGDRQAALPYLAQAYRIYPDSPEIGNDFLDALIQEGYVEQALEINRNLLELLPDDYQLHERLVILLSGMKRYAEARSELALLRTANPDSNRLLLLNGEILIRSGDDEAALAAYREALAALPWEGESIYVTMAGILQGSGDDQSLPALWNEALAAYPESAGLRLGAMRDRIIRGSFDDASAIAAAGDSIGPPPDAVQPIIKQNPWTEIMAELLIQEGHGRRAINTLQPLSDSGRISLEGDVLLGRLLAREKDLAPAILHLRKVCAAWPESGVARMYLGQFLADSGDLSGGEKSIRAGAELEPESSDILMSLITLLATRYPEAMVPLAVGGDTLARREEIGELSVRASDLIGFDSPRSSMLLGITLQGSGRLDLAAKHYASAAEDDDLHREALLNLSLVEDDLDHPDRVFDILEHLLTAYPGDPVVQNALGYSLADQGVQLSRAERLIRLALEQDPENPAFLDSLGWVLYRRNDLRSALDHLVSAANALPDDPTILEHLGLALRDLGQIDQALNALYRARLAGSVNEDLPRIIAELEAEVAP